MLRQRLQLPTDQRLANPFNQVTYDGTLNLDLKHDPKLGPHTLKFDLNRLREDAIDADISYQARVDEKPMSVDVKINISQQNPIYFKYDEILYSQTNFSGILKYSFNTKDNTVEKTYKCDVNRMSSDNYSIVCQGERTKLTLHFDQATGTKKFVLDLNRFAGERIGYENTFDVQTGKNITTLYLLTTAWSATAMQNRLSAVSIKQKDEEVFRVEIISLVGFDVKLKFSPSNIELK